MCAKLCSSNGCSDDLFNCLAIRIDGQSSNSLLVTYLGRLTRRVYSLWRLWHAATKDGVPSDTEL